MFLFILLTNSHAQDFISADRPSVAAGSSIVPQGTTQLEAGLYMSGIEVDAPLFSTPFMLRYGVLPRFETRVYSAGVTIFDSNLSTSLDASGIQGKVNVYQEESSPLSVGILGSIDFLTEDEYGGGLHLLVDLNMDTTSYWLNVGATTIGMLEYNTIPYSLGVGRMFAPQHGLFIETAGIISDVSIFTAEVGYFWLSESLQIDLYLQRNLAEIPNYVAAVGFAYRFR